MTAEILQTTNEAGDNDCGSCVFETSLCLRAAIKAVRSQDVEEHNDGVRAIIGMTSLRGVIGEISCSAPSCEQKQHVDTHYLIIDPL